MEIIMSKFQKRFLTLKKMFEKNPDLTGYNKA
jgi:hypothetical protein